MANRGMRRHGNTGRSVLMVKSGLFFFFFHSSAMSLTQVRDVSVEDICKRTKPRKHYVSFFQRAIKPTGKEVVMKRLESEDFGYNSL